METIGSLLNVLGALWATAYEALGGVAEAATLVTALVILAVAWAFFNSTKSFVADVVMTGVISASAYIALTSVYSIRSLDNGALLATALSVFLGIALLIQSFNDGNTKMKVIDVLLIAILIAAVLFYSTSLNPDSRIGELALNHLQAVGDFWSNVFNDSAQQLSE